MSYTDPIFVDRETFVAIGVLWLLAFVCALAIGKDVVPALFWSALVVFALSIFYVVSDSEGRNLVASPAKAIRFLAFGALFALISFAGDCLIGSFFAPDVSLLTACTEHSGIGFGITLLFLAGAVGTPILALLRSAVGVLWRRSG